jgi:hypothetical protein
MSARDARTRVENASSKMTTSEGGQFANSDYEQTPTVMQTNIQGVHVLAHGPGGTT